VAQTKTWTNPLPESKIRKIAQDKARRFEPMTGDEERLDMIQRDTEQTREAPCR